MLHAFCKEIAYPKDTDFFCRSQKFEDPAEGEPALVQKFSKLYEDLTAGFRNLEDEYR